jgi:hypothetical protein
MLVRSQATNQRPADRTARTGDQNSHPRFLSRKRYMEGGLTAAHLLANVLII